MHYKKKRLSPEKILLLEDLGFTWDLLETQWQASYAKLKTFRSIHGHCNVSVVYKKDKLLGNWAHNQRQMYKKGILTQDRVKMLNLLGFVWHQ